MGANPFLGVFFHWLGGLASGSFYVPYKAVREWSWETYWLVGGFFSWIIVPWVLGLTMTANLLGVLTHTSSTTLFWAYFFGVLWGLGGLTFGLTMRYLGMSLGMGVALGYCAAFGTLVPPIFNGELGGIVSTWPGLVILAGVVVCLLGIGVAALAGLTKEREMPEDKKKEAIKEFNFTKGILVATFSGIMSSCFAFGLAAGDPIKVLSLRQGYIESAAADRITVADAQPIDPAASKNLIDALKATAFFKDAPAEVKAKPSLVGVIDQLEDPYLLNTKLADLKAAAAKGEDNKKDLAKTEADAGAANARHPAQLALLAAANNPIAARLLAYDAQLAKFKDKSAELTIIQGLKDLTVKEVAMSVISAGGNLVSYHAKRQLWQGLPVLVVVLLGGFTTNFIWCFYLNLINRTGYQYFSSKMRNHAPKREDETIIETAIDAPSEEAVEQSPSRVAAAVAPQPDRAPMLRNYFFSALAGTTWYMQFFFYTMGETQMGRFGFASWTLHMASIIIFSTMWGWILHEWKGASKKAHSLIASGIIILIVSTVVIGGGTWLKGLMGAH